MTAIAGGAVAAAALYTVLARELPTVRPIARHRLRAVARRASGLTLAAVREEVLWRWLVLGGGALVVGVPGAFVVATAGFAMAHWRQAGRRSVLVHAVTGCVFGGVYVAGGLFASIVAHSVYNLLVLSAIESHGGGARAP